MGASDTGKHSVPGPKALPALGNILDIDIEDSIASVSKLFKKYGPIFKLRFNGKDEIFVGSQDLVNELCDEKRFVKCVTGGLEHLRPVVGDGLFTAHDGERGWGIAHRILMPALGPTSIRSMFDDMDDLCEQLCLKWARAGSAASLDVVNDFTRLTLDTIGLCTMGYRFNSFYQGEATHPFIKSMIGVLTEAGIRGFLPGFTSNLRPFARQQFDKDVTALRETSRKVIQNRRESPSKHDDLLNGLLTGRDPVTGEGMTDDSIINNLITFLVAGHETTSGLLSFTTYYLLKHPKAMERAVVEVDEVVGADTITIDHLAKLPYLDAALKETLRLMPTAPGFTLQSRKPEILGGKYKISPGTPINIILSESQRDLAVFGSDAYDWKPERMLDAEFKKLPPNAWKPFGNGARGCIGRPFAWQESLLVLATVLKTFKLELDQPSYELKVKETLTIKPEGFYCRAALRHDKQATSLRLRGNSTGNGASDFQDIVSTMQPDDSDGLSKGITILYGSNMGTCRALAYRLASDARRRGFKQPTVKSLYASVSGLPADEPVIIITSSYDGQPTDDAKNFVSWLECTPSLTGTQFAVFGCGHRDWSQTFHRIPKLVDKLMEEAGATRLVGMGCTDIATSDAFEDLLAWEKVLWSSLGIDSSADSQWQMPLRIEPPLQASLVPGLSKAVVVESRILTNGAASQKVHVELELPENIQYQPGDHIRILPHNQAITVSKVLAYFHVSQHSVITMQNGNHLGVPGATRITALELFSSCVELSKPATVQDLQYLIRSTEDVALKTELNNLLTMTDDTFDHGVRPSVFDLLEHFRDMRISLGAFVSMLHPIQPRTYSASSSPTWHKSHMSITLSVLDLKSWDNSRRYLGVASNYIATLPVGSVLYVANQAARPLFHPSTEVPMIMICAGSGLGPFRGFIQDRVLNLRQSLHKDKKRVSLPPACLFFGCRTSTEDLMYQDEFETWKSSGAVDIKLAFSRELSNTNSRGCKYVQDRLLVESDTIRDLWDQGAIIYACGSRSMGEGVRRALEQILGQEKLTDSRFVAELFTH